MRKPRQDPKSTNSRDAIEAGTLSSYSMTVTAKSASPRHPVTTFSSRRLFRTAKRIRTRAIPPWSWSHAAHRRR